LSLTVEKAQTPTLAELDLEGPGREQRSYWSLVWRKFRRHRAALVGGILLAVSVLGAALGPALSPYDQYEIKLNQMVQPPSLAHPLGTDDLGRDELTRVLGGGRISLSLGLMATVISVVLGGAVGSVSGFYGGRMDNVLMRLTDLMISFPQLFLMMFFSALFGKTVLSIAIVIGTLSWMNVARLVRASFLSIKEEEYVLAARSVGAGSAAIMARHILPNAMGPVIVAGTIGVAQAIIMESALSYLGLGVQLPVASWGSMLRLAQNQMTTAWWLPMFPGLMIVLAVLSINFMGDGLRDALDPRHLLK
jgi:peptide/nickel transport system permease protein